MATKDIYKLQGKTAEQVHLAYIAFMGDKISYWRVLPV